MKKSVIVSWSGGKDSALTFDALSRNPEFDVVGLLTSITREFDRISVHGVRRSMLEAQVDRLGLPLFEISLSPACTNEAYEAAFRDALENIRRAQADTRYIAFGDLYLEDVRAYRERLLEGSGFEPVFPLWGTDTADLARRFVADGFGAHLVCVDTTQLDRAFAGRRFDGELLSDLPKSVDPCGERGEFHTFVWNAPQFSKPIPFQLGSKVLRDERFMYCDVQ